MDNSQDFKEQFKEIEREIDLIEDPTLQKQMRGQLRDTLLGLYNDNAQRAEWYKKEYRRLIAMEGREGSPAPKSVDAQAQDLNIPLMPPA